MVIYEPKGKAREYCELAINLYRGCGHGCSYCYSPSVLRLTKENFKQAQPRKDIISQIIKEAPQYSGKEIQLCFTCDPYQQIDDELQLTRQTIKILHENNISIRILTKGGQRSARDFDLLGGADWYGATLTFINNSDSIQYEPDASLPQERFDTLKKAHTLGIQTWASLEPVIKPQQSLEIINQTYSFIDIYKIGKWNHNKEANQIDWKDFGHSAISLLEKYNKKYYIKKDLAAFL